MERRREMPPELVEDLAKILADVLVADFRRYPVLAAEELGTVRDLNPRIREGSQPMAKFEVVSVAELKTRLPAKLLPLVEEFKGKLENLDADQGGRLVLEKGDDAKDLRKALKAAAGSLNRRVRFPFRGEEGSLSFYLEGRKGRRGRRAAAAGAGTEAPKRRRGRPRKAAS